MVDWRCGRLSRHPGHGLRLMDFCRGPRIEQEKGGVELGSSLYQIDYATSQNAYSGSDGSYRENRKPVKLNWELVTLVAAISESWHFQKYIAASALRGNLEMAVATSNLQGARTLSRRGSRCSQIGQSEAQTGLSPGGNLTAEKRPI